MFFSFLQRKFSFNDKGGNAFLIENLEIQKNFKGTEKKKTFVPLLPETIVDNMLMHFLLHFLFLLNLVSIVSVFAISYLPLVLF